VVRNSQNDLRGSIKPALNVGVDPFIVEAGGAEVNDFDAALVDSLQEDIFWLQVAVDDVVLLHVGEADQDLDGEPPDQILGHPLEVVVLNELIQIYAQHLKRYTQVVPPGEVVPDFHHVFIVLTVILPQMV